MDKTLMILFAVTGLLIAMLAPHATFTLVAIVSLSVLATRFFWAVVQSFEDTDSIGRVFD